MTGIQSLLILLLAFPPASLDRTGPPPASSSLESATFDGTRFRSPEPREVRLGDWIRRRLHSQRGPWPKFIATPLGEAPPERVCDGELRVTLINHSTLLVQMDGVTFLTDPVWSERASPVAFVGPYRHVPPGVALGALPPIDFVVVSHAHYDHTDLPTLARLAAAGGPRFFVPLRLGALLRDAGVAPVEELDWWESRRVGGVVVTCVPAQHWSARGLFDRDRTLWSGWAVSGPSRRFYYAGDSGYFAGFAEIGERLGGIDLAAVPIGAYEPEAMMRPFHMNPEEAVRAARDVGAARLIGVHYGTFDLTDEPLDEPPRRFAAAAASAGIDAAHAWTPPIGETRPW